MAKIKYILVAVFLVFFLSKNCLGQLREFKFDGKGQSNQKATRIFVTAIWCSPCMGKYKEVIKDFEKDTTYNNIILFDALGFNVEKLKRIEPNFYTLSKTFFIPRKFYKKSGLVTFNLPDKALKRFLHSLDQFNLNFEIDKFWYGDILIVKGNTIRSERLAEKK